MGNQNVFMMPMDPSGRIVLGTTSKQVSTQEQAPDAGKDIAPIQEAGVIQPGQQATPSFNMPIDAGGGIIVDKKPVQEAPTEEEPGFWARAADMVTGKLRTTKETEEFPEFISQLSDEDVTKENMKILGGLYFASNDEAKKDIIRENIPGAKITEDEKGNTVIELPDGRKSILNKPGLSHQDVAGLLGDIGTFFGAGKLAGMGKSLVAKAAIGGAASAATEAAAEKSVQALGSKQEVDPTQVALAGVLGGAGELVGPVAKKISSARKAKALGAEVDDFTEAIEGVTSAERVTKKTGIPLFRAQKTGGLTDLDRQAYVATLPGASKKAASELKSQNKKAYDAVIDVMDTIAPAEAVETASGEIRSIAQQALEAQKAIRAEKASPLYNEAFKSKKLNRVTRTRKLVSDKLKDLPPSGEVAKSLNKVKSFLTPKGTGKGSGLRMKQLHNSKLEIDQMISKVGEGSLGSTTKKELVDVKNVLLEEISPDGSAYDQARKVFTENTPAVKELEDSIIGKISKLDDTQLKSVSSKLFDPAEAVTNPQAISKARKVIEKQDPQAWNDIMRTEFERRLGKMKTGVDEIGAVENVPKQLHNAVFGNVQQRKALYAGLDKETAKTLRYVQEGLKRASEGRPTALTKQVGSKVDKELKSGIGGAIRSWFTPIKTVSGLGAEYSYTKNARALSDVMFDPKWKPQLKELRAMKPGSNAASKKFLNMLNKASSDIGKPALQSLKPDNSNQGE